MIKKATVYFNGNMEFPIEAKTLEEADEILEEKINDSSLSCIDLDIYAVNFDEEN